MVLSTFPPISRILVSLFHLVNLLFVVNFIHFFVLQDLAEAVTCHVCVIGSFVVVREKLGTVVVDKTVLEIEVELEEFSESFVVLALLKHLSKDGLAEVVSLEAQDFGVVGSGEDSVPLANELLVSVRQRANELVVDVEDVVHHVVADQTARGVLLELGLHHLHYKAEPHFLVEQFLAQSLSGFLLLPLFGAQVQILHLLIHLKHLRVRCSSSAGRPGKLLSTKQVHKQTPSRLKSMLSRVDHSSVPVLKLKLLGN